MNWTLGSSKKGKKVLVLEDVKKISQLFEKRKDLTIDGVGIELGNHTFSSKNISRSPCEDGGYYLLKHISKTRNYELTNEIPVNRSQCLGGSWII